MHVEMYSRSDADKIAALCQEAQDKTDPEQWLLEELGFSRLVPFTPKPTDQLDELFDRLTLEEVKAWRRLLVKRWQRNNGSWRSFSKHIPLEVLQAIPAVKPLFDNLEIWEPEYSSNGFLLVGVIYDPTQEPMTDDNFMIARWANDFLGLSFAELREDVVEIGQIREKQAKQRWLKRTVWLCVCVIITVAVFISILLQH